MANRSHVPKFGNWESGENVPYTVYFDKARKGKTGGKMINPNDPQENPDLFSEDAPSFEAPTPKAAEPAVKVGQGPIRSKSDDADFRRTVSPVRNESAGPKATTESSHQRHGDRVVTSGEGRETPKRPTQQSPLHPHYQPKSGNKGSAISSPSYERRSSESMQGGLAPNTPSRSRLRSAARGDETPDKSTAVPKFGEWDENNPASADGFTHIFNKVREEKQGAGNASPMPKNSYSNSYSNQAGDGKGCGCFSWLSKK